MWDMHPILAPNGRWETPYLYYPVQPARANLITLPSSSIYSDNLSFWNDLEEGAAHFLDVEIEVRKGEVTSLRLYNKRL